MEKKLHLLPSLKTSVLVQENNYDCGMFVCMFAEHFSRGRHPSNFQQTYMHCLRRHMKEQLLQMRCKTAAESFKGCTSAFAARCNLN